MDPNANLAEQRELIQRIINEHDKPHPDPERMADYAARLTGLTEVMDTWLSSGGFLPAAWQRKG